tara:strand:+ start:1283 stop:1441 length:159 start_codon:yes stop_codon:yes gene_type:complete
MPNYNYKIANNQKVLVDKILLNSRYSSMQDYIDGTIEKDTKWLKQNPNKALQ